MDLHSLRRSGPKAARKRVGRGHRSGQGKTSGRGHKGQMARSGASRKPLFEGGQMPLYRTLPKRGFTPVHGVVFVTVNTAALEARFESGSRIDLAALKAAGLANGPRGTRVKILGRGDLSKKLDVQAHAFSASARQKIEAAGGSCEVVS